MTQYNGIKIPAAQDLHPAGFDHIAFRPMCQQLTSVGRANGNTEWALQMPDGKTEVLKVLPSGWTVDRAYETLNSAGLCKLGNELDGLVRVPIVYTHQLPQAVIPEIAVGVSDQVVDPGAEFSRAPIETYFGVVLLVVGLGLMLHSCISGSRQSTTTVQGNTSQSDADALLAELFK